MMEIKITLDDSLNVSDQLKRYMLALGYVPQGTVSASMRDTWQVKPALDGKLPAFHEASAEPLGVFVTGLSSGPSIESVATEPQTEPTTETAPARRRRRTKAEIEADEARAAAAGPTPLEEAIAAAPAISTGEERISPQDAADEATEATPGELTHDDLRKAVSEYRKVHGMAAAAKNIPDILGCSIIEVSKDGIAAAIDKVMKHVVVDDALVSDMPVDPAPEPEPVQATKADVIEALKAYVMKYGAEAEGDAVALIRSLFGVEKISAMPNDPVSYGKALTAANEMLANNPHGRVAA
jgi:hypothetical protein